MELQTGRLILRQWRDSDREPFAAMGASGEVMEHFPARMTRTDSDSFIDRMTAHIDDHGWGLWSLESRETGAFLGFTGLSVPGFDAHFTPAVEVGWRLARHAWGYGYASEAARRALVYGFESLGLRELVSFATATNVRSQAVMDRIGMTHDPADDFDHPAIVPSSPLNRHVLYRTRS